MKDKLDDILESLKKISNRNCSVLIYKDIKYDVLESLSINKNFIIYRCISQEDNNHLHHISDINKLNLELYLSNYIGKPKIKLKENEILIAKYNNEIIIDMNDIIEKLQNEKLCRILMDE